MTIGEYISKANVFYEVLENDKNARYRSWEHCYKEFCEARKTDNPNIDRLCLQLAFYLASWGMYRGSSFLLQKDYRVHECAVKIILKKEYDPLFGIRCEEYLEENNQTRLCDIKGELTGYYEQVRKSTKSNDINTSISDTLITKILMGALGCVPAYDRYFVTGVKTEKVTTGIFNIKSVLRLIDFYKEHENDLENSRKSMKIDSIEYPQMKLLDMIFWQIGYEIEEKKRTNNEGTEE